MYLDMIHEKIAELKGVAQYLDWKKGIRPPASPGAAQRKGSAAFKGAPLTPGGQGQDQRPVKPVPSTGNHIGKKGWLFYPISCLLSLPFHGFYSNNPVHYVVQPTGKSDETVANEGGGDESADGAGSGGDMKPLDLSGLKTRASAAAKKERREAASGEGADVTSAAAPEPNGVVLTGEGEGKKAASKSKRKS